MTRVEIYTTPYCPYCLHAKALLDKKGVAYEETDVSGNSALRTAMSVRAEGRTTVPQIFIDGQPIGGCDDMVDLDRQGKLNPLLGLPA
jgi:glutaredoxin 3